MAKLVGACSRGTCLGDDAGELSLRLRDQIGSMWRSQGTPEYAYVVPLDEHAAPCASVKACDNVAHLVYSPAHLINHVLVPLAASGGVDLEWTKAINGLVDVLEPTTRHAAISRILDERC